MLMEEFYEYMAVNNIKLSSKGLHVVFCIDVYESKLPNYRVSLLVTD